ncbi:hypothetical protein F5Y15DRAFT_254174 [Xylariaceae sp. FL0016]|nr:hypothetical protein F5Y15DRAFT_254174 [Xylariaceae sp. FL0016]
MSSREWLAAWRVVAVLALRIPTNPSHTSSSNDVEVVCAGILIYGSPRLAYMHGMGPNGLRDSHSGCEVPYLPTYPPWVSRITVTGNLSCMPTLVNTSPTTARLLSTGDLL